MKILYIHQYFKTPSQPGGTRSYWFSKKLIESGYEVTMITSRGNQKKRIERESIEGINVIYIRNQYSNSMGILRRMISFVRFMMFSTFIALSQKRVSLIYATSTPLTIGIPALLCKWLKKTPYYFEVRDLWPEVPIQMGGLNSPILRKLARAVEHTIYRNAAHIIALSPGMKEGVLRSGIEAQKVSMIPNMSKTDKFFKREKNSLLAVKFGIDLNKFNVIHFGTMGKANGLDYLISAFEVLAEKKVQDVNLIFMGDGAVKEKLKFEVEKKKLKNIIFIDAQPMEIVSEIVNLCNVSIVPFLNLPILSTNSPNKLFDSLSAGLPIIVNSSGWTKDLVENNGCGAFVDPQKPDELVELVLKWKNDKSALEKMGKSARYLAENIYDKSILCHQFIEVVGNFFEKKLI